MKIKIVSLILSISLFTGCGQNPDTSADAPAEESATASFDSVYAAAEEALAIAQERRNVWSKTEEMLHDSKVAYDDGRVDEAIQMATEARLQAELAVTQADREKDAWRSRVLNE
jgi:hypothetical protein